LLELVQAVPPELAVSGPARLVEGPLGGPEEIRQGENDGTRDDRASLQGGRLDRDFVKRCLDALNGVNSPSLEEAKNFAESANVKNVGELVQHMAKNDLGFGPAVAGDEAAYLTLYRALAIYDVSANLQATNSGSRVVAK